MAFRWVIETGRDKGASVDGLAKAVGEAKAPAAPEANKPEPPSPQSEEKAGGTSITSIGLLIAPLLAAMGAWP